MGEVIDFNKARAERGLTKASDLRLVSDSEGSRKEETVVGVRAFIEAVCTAVGRESIAAIGELFLPMGSESIGHVVRRLSDAGYRWIGGIDGIPFTVTGHLLLDSQIRGLATSVPRDAIEVDRRSGLTKHLAVCIDFIWSDDRRTTPFVGFTPGLLTVQDRGPWMIAGRRNLFLGSNRAFLGRKIKGLETNRH